MEDAHAGGVSCNLSTLPLKTAGPPGPSARPGSCRPYLGRAVTSCHVAGDTVDFAKASASFRKESETMGNNPEKMGCLPGQRPPGDSSHIGKQLQRAIHREATGVTLLPPCLPAQLHQNPAISEEDSDASQGDSDHSVEGYEVKTATKGSKLNQKTPVGPVGLPWASQQVVVDVQALQALQERLLFSEEKLWLTQRQLIDEQGKEVHLKSQILYLEDEVERAQAEGLATATRYAEQSELLQQLQDKVNRLSEEIDNLESCLNEKISEERALQELAERLVLRLGTKTDALLEEGVCVTRVLAPAWKKEELLAEFKKEKLLRFQLAHVALLYCRNGTADSQQDAKVDASMGSEEERTTVHAPAYAPLEAELSPTIFGRSGTRSSLPLCCTSDTQTTAESSFTPATDRALGQGLPASAGITEASLFCDDLVENRCQSVAPGGTSDRHNTHDSSLLSQSTVPAAPVESASTHADGAAGRFRDHRECAESGSPPNCSLPTDVATRQEEASAALSPHQDIAAAIAQSHRLAPSRTPSLVGNTTESTKYPGLQSTRSSPELESEALSLTKTKRGQCLEHSRGPFKQQDGIDTANQNNRFTSGIGPAAKECVLRNSHPQPPAAELPPLRNLLPEVRKSACAAKPFMTTGKPRLASVPKRFPLSEASTSQCCPSLRRSIMGSGTRLQRVRSEAWNAGLLYNRLSPSSLPIISTEEARAATATPLSGSTEPPLSPPSDDNAEAGLVESHAPIRHCRINQHRERQRGQSSAKRCGQDIPATWSGGSKEIADACSLKTFSKILSYEASERAHPYPPERGHSLAPISSDDRAPTRETKASCRESRDTSTDKVDAVDSLPNDARVADIDTSIEFPTTLRPSSESHSVNPLQPLSRAGDAILELIHRDESSAGQHGGSTDMAIHSAGVPTDVVHCAAVVAGPLVADTVAGAHNIHSPPATAVADEMTSASASQPTPGKTFSRPCASPRATTAGLVREDLSLQSTQRIPEPLQKAQLHEHPTGRDCKYGGRQQPHLRTLPSDSTASIKNKEQETQVVAADEAVAHEATAPALTPWQSTGFTSGEKSTNPSKSDGECICVSSTLNSGGQPASREAQGVTSVQATPCSIAEDGVEVYARQERETKGDPQRQLTNSHSKYLADIADDSAFALECELASTNGPLQAAQHLKTYFPSESAHQAASPASLFYSDDATACVNSSPFDLHTGNSTQKLCGLNLEALKLVQAEACRLSLEGELPKCSDHINTHMSDTQHSSCVPYSEEEPSKAERPVAAKTADSTTTRRRITGPRLPPLPQHYSSKFAHASAFTAEFKGYYSSPARCPASRRTAGTDASRRDPSSACNRLHKRLPSAGTVCAPACIDGIERLPHESASARRGGSRRQSKANRSVELEEKPEALKTNNLLHSTPNIPPTEPCASTSSLNRWSGEAFACAGSVGPDSRFSRTRQPSQEGRRRSRSTVKAATSRVALVDSVETQQQEEQQDERVSFRRAPCVAREAASHRSSRHLVVAGDTKLPHTNLDGETPALLVDGGEVFHGNACAYGSESRKEEAKHRKPLAEESSSDASAAVFSIKPAASSVKSFRKASCRGLSVLQGGARGTKSLKVSVPLDAVLEASIRKESCTASKSSSGLIRSTSIAAQQPVASTTLKKSGTNLNSSRRVRNGPSHPHPVSGRMSSSGRTSSRTSASGNSSSSSRLSTVYDGSSDADDVYHGIPATGRGVQQATTRCFDHRRKKGERCTQAASAGVPIDREDIRTTAKCDSKGLYPPMPRTTEPSSVGNESLEVTRDRMRCATPTSGRQHQEQWIAASATLPHCYNAEVSQSAPVDSEQSCFTSVAGKPNATVLSGVAPRVPPRPLDGDAVSPEAQGNNRQNNVQSTALGPVMRLEKRAPPLEAPHLKRSPLRGACVVPLSLTDLQPPTGPAAKELLEIPETVKDTQKCWRKPLDGEQQQDSTHRADVNHEFVAPLACGAKWTSVDAVSGAQTAPSTRCGSTRVSLPLPSDACDPAHAVHSVGNHVASKMPAGTLESEEDASQDLEATEKAADVFAERSTRVATELRESESARREPRTISCQLKTQWLADTTENDRLHSTCASVSPTAERRKGEANSESRPLAHLDERVTGTTPASASRDVPPMVAREQLTSQHGIKQEHASAQEGIEDLAKTSAGRVTNVNTAGIQQNDVKATMPPRAEESTVKTIRPPPPQTSVSAATAHGKLAEESFPKTGCLMNACTRYTEPSVIQVPPPYSTAGGNRYIPFELQYQGQAATTVYQSALCGLFAGTPAAPLAYGAVPAAFPLWSRSSVPLQQQSRNRAAQIHDLCQQQGFRATAEHRQEHSHPPCAQQEHPRHPVDWNTGLRPQVGQPGQPRRHRAQAQPLLSTEQKTVLQTGQPASSVWQHQNQQHPGVLQQDQARQHARTHPTGGSALLQVVTQQPAPQQPQVQPQMAKSQKIPVQVGQTRPESSPVIPTQFVRQTLPRKSVENALGSPFLSRQQETQHQPGIGEKLRSHHEETARISGTTARTEASDSRSTCDLRRVTRLQPQQQQQNWTCRAEQPSSTTGPVQQDVSDWPDESQHMHIVEENSPSVDEPRGRQGGSLELDGTSRHPRPQQSLSGSHQQHQVAPSVAERQHTMKGVNIRLFAEKDGPPIAHQQVPLPSQVKRVKAGSQLQHQVVQHVHHFEQQQPQKLQGGHQAQALPARYTWGKAVPAPQLQPPVRPLQHYQPQQQSHTMSMRWSCGVPSGTKKDLQDPFRPQPQRQHQVQPQLQQKMQRWVVQQEHQPQLHILHLEAQRQHEHLQCLPQQQTQADPQVQQQRTQQQLLQKHFWNLVQMYRGGGVPTCPEKGNPAGAVFKTFAGPTLLSLGGQSINHKTLGSDSRATISAEIKSNAASLESTYQAPFGEATPSTTLAAKGNDTSFRRTKMYVPAASSLPPSIPTIQASRLTAPVFPAAAAANSKSSMWRRQ